MADGTKRRYEFTANYDGKDNPVVGNNPDADMVARTRVNANTIQTISKKGGKVTTTQTSAVSSDGKTRTATTKGVNTPAACLRETARHTVFLWVRGRPLCWLSFAFLAPICNIMAPCLLRIVVFRETLCKWTARGLDHDLAAGGATAESAVDTLFKVARAHIAYDRRHNREPLSAFAAAPRAYWDAFTHGTPFPIPLALDCPDAGVLTRVVVAIAAQNPAIRPFRRIARSA